MLNFKCDILEEVGQDNIEAVIILAGAIDSWSDTPDPRDISVELCGIPLTWDQAAPLLDYSYDAGFGCMDCHNILVYTSTYVIYVHEYDGSTELRSIPRNPSAFKVQS